MRGGPGRVWDRSALPANAPLAPAGQGPKPGPHTPTGDNGTSCAAAPLLAQAHHP